MGASLQRPPAHVSVPFGTRAPGPVSGQLGSDSGWSSRHNVAGFLSAFACRHWLVEHPVPARGFRSPYGRPTGPRPDPVGVSMFRTRETRPGWVPSVLRGGWCPADQSDVPDRHLPLLSGQPCNPLEHPIGEPGSDEAYEDSVSFTRPASPAPAAPGWNGTGFGFYPGLRTSRSPATPAKAGAVPRTLDRITPSHHRASKRRDHSQRATSRRTVRSAPRP